MEIALQHPSFCADQGVICRLLCASRNLQAEVRDFCAHSLALHCKAVTPQTILQFAAWIAAHSQLVGSLSWEMPPEPRAALLESQAALAHALQKAAAAAAPEGLQLHHYQCSCPSGAVLAYLPAQHLTSLEFTFHPDYDAIGATISVLAGLTNLQELSIHGRDVGPLLAAPLQLLSQLTRLQLGLVRNVTDLQQLPAAARLRQLQLTAVTPRWHSQQQLNLRLGHLTSLDDLQIQAPDPRCLALPDQPVVVQPGDKLSPHLTKLAVTDCSAAEPLLHLQQLQSVSMESSTMPAGQLALVGRMLHRLTQLHLGYCSPGSADNAASAWTCSLPVASLCIMGCSLASCSVQRLPQLGASLTALHLCDCKPLGCSAWQFAAVLLQLQQLEELTLSSIQLLDADCCDGATAGVGAYCSGTGTSEGLADGESNSSSSYSGSSCTLPSFGNTDSCSSSSSSSSQELLARAIASLPRLLRLCIVQLIRPLTDDPDAARSQQLQLETLELGLAAVQQLTAAVQLTHLTLAGCGITDDAAAVLAKSLTRLHELVLDDNPAITDKGATLIKQLPRLDMLSLHGTSAGVHSCL